jgi:hypothetical protein
MDLVHGATSAVSSEKLAAIVVALIEGIRSVLAVSKERLRVLLGSLAGAPPCTGA